MARRESSSIRLAKLGAGLILLVAVAEAGDMVARTTGLPVPGAVLGMGAYLALLTLLPRAFDWSLPGARTLTGLLGALIVPAAVGLAAFVPELRVEALPLAAAIIVSTAVTCIATAGAYRLIMRKAKP